MRQELSEQDLRLIHAVQVSPRAPWTTVGPACGMHPITAARRWQRLVDRGLVSVLVTPGPALLRRLATAYLDVECPPSDREAVIAALLVDPRVASITIAGSGRSLFLTLMAASHQALADLVLARIETLPGVLRTELYPITQVYGEGSSWRLDALARSEIRGLDRRSPRAPRPFAVSERHRALFRALSLDARAPVAALAEQVGESPSTTSRRVAAMLASGLVSIRCDVTQEAAGWPILVNYFLRVPAAELDAVGRALAALPENRGSFAVAARPNLFASQWLRHVSDVPYGEARMTGAIPSLEVLDRMVALRVVKRMGRVLDADGRSIGVVPLDPWHESVVTPPAVTDRS
ncbi:Lrp/AsnC family transcriptional regulator [Nonomuraea roseoviolacea]|uniref:DNA-binding Lrp family transcriptional regulator n=1 Tax=Nonomuraea roseoviolacea subsp. carminata TaxID=160689 RepID=A0ABT1KCP8_9ACTN|nr:Lrp/AsnC family transcriptional regulator [Nonomuraea roseoviolacea]MCP2351746.1 DNA-binding Lrp family transcriptional regulator [Nonomuraea roseoviolacea subsp. carminata]